jgi:hypothetical protein
MMRVVKCIPLVVPLAAAAGCAGGRASQRSRRPVHRLCKTRTIHTADSRQQTADSRQQTSKTRDKGHKTSKTRDKGHTHTEQATNKQDTRVNRRWTIDKQDPKRATGKSQGSRQRSQANNVDQNDQQLPVYYAFVVLRST